MIRKNLSGTAEGFSKFKESHQVVQIEDAEIFVADGDTICMVVSPEWHDYIQGRTELMPVVFEDVQNVNKFDSIKQSQENSTLQTNADRIRAMSVEEIAQLLCDTGWTMSDRKECEEWLNRTEWDPE